MAVPTGVLHPSSTGRMHRKIGVFSIFSDNMWSEYDNFYGDLLLLVCSGYQCFCSVEFVVFLGDFSVLIFSQFYQLKASS